MIRGEKTSIKCNKCNHELKVTVAYDGLGEFNAVRGKDFDWAVSLDCDECGRCYDVCRVRVYFDVSDIKTQ